MSDRERRNSTQGESRFTTTHWSMVLAAGNLSSPDYQKALSALCETYWFPIYAYLRRQGYDYHRAGDYTQAFFASLLERQSIGRADSKQGSLGLSYSSRSRIFWPMNGTAHRHKNVVAKRKFSLWILRMLKPGTAESRSMTLRRKNSLRNPGPKKY